MFGGSETLLHLLPVDDLPHLLEVGWSRISIVEVVGVFPNINTQKRDETGAHIHEGILVLGRAVLKQATAFVVGEPAPARALNSSGLSIEIVLEVLNRTPLSFDHGAQVGALIGEMATTFADWGEYLPELLVVEMATAIEFDEVAQLDVFLDIACSKCLGGLLTEIVQVVYIRAVMLTVVEIHDLAGDDWFEGAKLIRKRLEHSCEWLGSFASEVAECN